MTYEWGEQFSSRVPAAVVGKVVERVEKRHGSCHPAALVEAARPESSPLHPLFQWDDEQAAESYRVNQARRVLRSLRVVVDGEVQRAPAFVHVRRIEQDGAVDGYMTTLSAMSDESSRAYVLADALRQLEGLRARYEGLLELAGVWEALAVAKTG